MEKIIEFFVWIYIQCTDFVIHLANLTGTSYYEMNFWLFCILYPLILVGSVVFYAVQRFRVWRNIPVGRSR